MFVMGFFSEAWSAVLGFIPGLLGAGVLLAAGSTRSLCYLTIRPLFGKGFAVLAVIFAFALAGVLPFSL